MAEFFSTLNLILKFWTEISTFAQMLNDQITQGKVNDANELRGQIRNAQTDDERRALVIKLAGLKP